MKTIETEAMVTTDGSLNLQMQLPTEIEPGVYRVIVTIDEKPLTSSISMDEKPANVLKETPASLYQVSKQHGSPETYQQRLEDQQMYWYSLPMEERQKYRGQYVAVHSQQVVDSDTDQRSLYLRIHKQFGADPVMIVHADWPKLPTYQIHSTYSNTP